MNLGKLLSAKSSIHDNKEKMNTFLNITLEMVARSGSYQYRLYNKDLYELLKIAHPDFEYKETAEYYLITWVSAKQGKALHLKQIADRILDDKDWFNSNYDNIKKKLIKEVESNSNMLMDYADKGFNNVKIYTDAFTCDEIRMINNMKRSDLTHLIPDLELILSVVDDKPVLYVKWKSTVLTDW